MKKISPAHHTKCMYWEKHVIQYNASGMSKAAYCRKHNLVYHQFVWWYHTLHHADSSTTGFVALACSLKATGNEHPVVIDIGGDTHKGGGWCRKGFSILWQYVDILLAISKYNKV
jgi:hypothetical protein